MEDSLPHAMAGPRDAYGVLIFPIDEARFVAAALAADNLDALEFNENQWVPTGTSLAALRTKWQERRVGHGSWFLSLTAFRTATQKVCRLVEEAPVICDFEHMGGPGGALRTAAHGIRSTCPKAHNSPPPTNQCRHAAHQSVPTRSPLCALIALRTHLFACQDGTASI